MMIHPFRAPIHTAMLASVLALPFAALGCSSTDSSTSGADVPELKVDEQKVAGPFKVASGEDTTMCTYVRSDTDSDQDISAFLTEQSQGGHHLIVYTIDHPVDLEPHRCSQGGQPSWTQILVTQLESEKIPFPAGVGFHVKAHQQYVMETHFINTTPGELEVTSKFGLAYAKPGEVTQRAATYFVGTMNVDVAPMTTTEKTAECHPPKAMAIHTMFGHEHRMGVALDVINKPGGQGGEMLYHSENWEAPPIMSFDSPLNLTPEDVLSVHCKWNNTSPDRLRYPHEMCYAIGYFWPSDTGIFCASGGGKDVCQCRETGALDTGPGGAAVEVTLTRKETIAGAGGDINTGAPVYCALFRAEDYTALGPKAGAQPYYFRDAVDQPLKTDKDTVKFDIRDVTPGDYAVSCMMDVVGGGFMPGTGDVANLTAPAVTVKKGDVAHVDVVLDLAVP
jgi:hypothetical protein